MFEKLIFIQCVVCLIFLFNLGSTGLQLKELEEPHQLYQPSSCALILYGLPRSYLKSFPYLQTVIKENKKHYNFDIYIYSSYCYKSSPKHHDSKIHCTDKDQLFDSLLKLYSQLGDVKFIDLIHEQHVDVHGMFGLKRVIFQSFQNQLLMSSKYAKFLYLRMDVIFKGPMELNIWPNSSSPKSVINRYNGSFFTFMSGSVKRKSGFYNRDWDHGILMDYHGFHYGMPLFFLLCHNKTDPTNLIPLYVDKEMKKRIFTNDIVEPWYNISLSSEAEALKITRAAGFESDIPSLEYARFIVCLERVFHISVFPSELLKIYTIILRT
jgi:hypothetical protein